MSGLRLESQLRERRTNGSPKRDPCVKIFPSATQMMCSARSINRAGMDEHFAGRFDCDLEGISFEIESRPSCDERFPKVWRIPMTSILWNSPVSLGRKELVNFRKEERKEK